jgi:hypothetical protein
MNSVGIETKKSKKDIKIITIMIKLFFYYVRLMKKKKILLNIRGIDIKIGKVIKALNNYAYVKKIYFLITPKITFLKKKFKKIKSIKKKFKKK